jgi:phage-related protein
MARAATAFVEFEGDFSKVSRDAGSQSKQLEGTFNTSFKRIAAYASAALGAIGVGKFLKDAFSAAEEAQKVNRLTAAVIKSTGGAAHVTASQVDEYAKSMSLVTGVEDDQIASAENVLLTFRDVRNEAGKGNDVFNQGVLAAQNLSAALGTDLQSSVIQVGKALNDPIKGMTALRRVGVSFTTDQIAQVKALVASGHQLEAQKLILGELTKEFGGAAAAAATPGAKLAASAHEIEESVGNVILPLFSKFASFVVTTVDPAIQSAIPFIENLAKVAIIAFDIGFGGDSIGRIHGWLRVFALIGTAVRGLLDFIRGNVSSAGVQIGKLFGLQEDDPRVTSIIKGLTRIRAVISSVVDFIREHWKPILVAAGIALALLIAPIVTLVAGLIALYIRFGVVRDVVDTVVQALIVAGRFVASIDWGRVFADVASVISASVAVIRSVITGIVRFFTSHSKDFSAIAKQIVAVWRQIVPTLRAALAAVVAIVRIPLGLIVALVVVAVQFLIGLWDRFGHQLLDHLRIAFNAVVLVVQGALQIIQGIFEVITGILTGHWSKAWDGLKDIAGGALKIVVGVVKALINEISTVIGLGMALISELWSAAWGRVRGVVTGVFDAVLGFVKRWWPLILGVLTGGLGLIVALFITHFGQIRSFVSNLVSDVVGFFRSLPGRIIALAARVGSAALSIGKSILTGILKGLGSAVSFVSSVGRSIANAAIGFINRIIDDINNALDIHIHVPGGGHFGIPKSIDIDPPNIPHIPTLDTGAVLNDPTLALLAVGPKAQPEIVTPEALMRKVFSQVLDTSRAVSSIDARTIVQGNIYGDSHLRAILSEHDRALELSLAAGARP